MDWKRQWERKRDGCSCVRLVKGEVTTWASRCRHAATLLAMATPLINTCSHTKVPATENGSAPLSRADPPAKSPPTVVILRHCFFSSPADLCDFLRLFGFLVFLCSKKKKKYQEAHLRISLKMSCLLQQIYIPLWNICTICNYWINYIHKNTSICVHKYK